MKVDEHASPAVPFVYTDKRALSQAWYDALYGPHGTQRDGRMQDGPTPHAPQVPPQHVSRQSGAGRDDFGGGATVARATTGDAGSARAGSASCITAAAVSNDAAGSAAARAAAERDAARNAARARGQESDDAGAAARPFIVDSGTRDDGRTTLIVRQDDSAVHVTAIAGEHEAALVAAALAEAHGALAARGISLHSDVRKREAHDRRT